MSTIGERLAQEQDPAIRREIVADWVQSTIQPVPSVDGEVGESPQAFESRDYQMEAWANLWEARHRGERSGLVHLATGLGKTSLAVVDVIKFREDYDGAHEYGPRFMWVSHQEDINDQAAERFASLAPSLSQGTFNRRIKETEKDITFATIQSLYRNLDALPPTLFDYIVFDEAHHTRATTFESVVRHFDPQFKLALTATPDRMDGLEVPELFGPTLYSKDLATALSEGLLVDVDYHLVIDDVIKEALQAGFSPESLQELHELFKFEPRNEVIAQKIRDEITSLGPGNAKTIVFCEDIEHTEAMAQLLGGEPYHSGIDREARTSTLKRFREGELQVIATRDMFNEGLDIPDAQLVAFVRSTASKTIFEQQLGRGLRRSPGKETVTVLDFVANIERIAMIKELGDAIKRNVNGREVDPADNTSSLASPSGLTVHTRHADFDFDRWSVDLLDAFTHLRGQADKMFLKQSREECIAYYKWLSDCLGHAALTEEIDQAHALGLGGTKGQLTWRFGGLRELREAAGLSWGEGDSVRYYQELSEDLGRPASFRDIDEASKLGRGPSTTVVLKEFDGKLKALREAAGGEANYDNWTREDAIEYYQELSNDLGRPATQKDIVQASIERKGPGLQKLLGRFGGNLPALKATLDYAPPNYGSWTESQAIDYYRQVSTRLGRSAKKADLEAAGKAGEGPSVPTLLKVFGGTLKELRLTAAEGSGGSE